MSRIGLFGCLVSWAAFASGPVRSEWGPELNLDPASIPREYLVWLQDRPETITALGEVRSLRDSPEGAVTAAVARALLQALEQFRP